MQGATLAAIVLPADVSHLPSSTAGCPEKGFSTINIVHNIAFIVIIPEVVPWFEEPSRTA